MHLDRGSIRPECKLCRTKNGGLIFFILALLAWQTGCAGVASSTQPSIQTSNTANNGASATTFSSGSGGGGGASAIPNSLGWYQIPNTQLASDCPSGVGGNTGCAAVMSAWSGAAADTVGNRMIIWGGGHQDYYGNEAYSLNLGANPITMTRITNPSAFNGACTIAQSDGNPTSRHTYSNLAFMPNVGSAGKMYAYGGAKANCGFSDSDAWSFDLSSFTWTRTDTSATNGPGIPCSNCVINYDSNSGGVFISITDVSDNATFWSYNPVTNSYTELQSQGPSGGISLNESGAIDTTDKLFFIAGNSQFFKVDISSGSSYVYQDIHTASGCGTAIAAAAPGMAFDPVNQDIVFWLGGSSVTIYNPVSNSCTVNATYSGGPGTAQSNGTFGRFRYFPALGVFVVVNDWQQNAYSLRLSPASGGAGAALQDFQARCAAPGVIVCQGFDDTAAFAHVTSGTGLYSSSDVPLGPNPYGLQDTTTYTSGGSSLHFPIPAQGGSTPDGYFGQLFPPFGNNSTLYIQFRQKMDAAFINNQWPASNGGFTYFKQFIISYQYNSCGNPDLVAVNDFNEGYPLLYEACGSPSLTTLNSQGNLLNEQGDTPTTGYNCEYSNPTPQTCFYYPANTWVTYLIEIQTGTFGQPNTSVKAWSALPGQPYQQFVNVSNFTFGEDNPGNGWSWIQLIPYWTDRSPNVSLTPANTWYDELIVSTQSIPAPVALPEK